MCFKGSCWLQWTSYKPPHKERTLPSHPIEKSTLVHDALTHHPIFSHSDTAKIFSYSLVVNLGTSLEKYSNYHTLWSQVDFSQVQTGDRWYYKVSFSFSFLFHGIRLQNRKQNRSLLLQCDRSGPVLYKGFQSRGKNVSVTDSLEKEWFITCCFTRISTSKNN